MRPRSGPFIRDNLAALVRTVVDEVRLELRIRRHWREERRAYLSTNHPPPPPTPRRPEPRLPDPGRRQ